MNKITLPEFEEIISEKPFNNLLLEKDYFVTIILYLLRDFPDIYFKGGTALNKIFLDYARLSEDIDLTVIGNVKAIKDKIESALKISSFFTSITQDKHHDKFTRIIVHYQGFYGNTGYVFIDLSQKKPLHLKPERHQINHFYTPYIPGFSFTTLAQQEMFAEKVRATIERNKPRDHFDLYQIITRKLPLDLKLAQTKCQESNCEFNILKMFNKANRLKRKWDEDMEPLLANKITFQEIMRTLAKHFHLKEEKEKRKKINDEIRDSEGYKKLLENINSLIKNLPPEIRAEIGKYDQLK